MHIILRTSLLLPGAALGLVLAACSSADMGPLNRSVATNTPLASTAEKASAEVVGTIAHVDAVTRAADELLNHSPVDLKRQYQTFVDGLDRLEDSASDLQDLTSDLQARGQDYFVNWDQEIAALRNEDIRNRSAERRAEVQRNFNSVRDEYIEVRERLGPFITRMQDIKRALATDLTTRGVAAVQPTFSGVNDDVRPLREALAELSNRFRSFGVALSTEMRTTDDDGDLRR